MPWSEAHNCHVQWSVEAEAEAAAAQPAVSARTTGQQASEACPAGAQMRLIAHLCRRQGSRNTQHKGAEARVSSSQQPWRRRRRSSGS